MKFSKYLVLAALLICVTKISGQELTMFHGLWTKYYQDDSQISKQQFESLMHEDSEANQLWQRSKRHKTIGLIAYGGAYGFLYWQYKRLWTGRSQTMAAIGAIGSAGVAIGFGLSANNLKKNAILKYNSNIDVGTLHFGLNYNGLGLVYSF